MKWTTVKRYGSTAFDSCTGGGGGGGDVANAMHTVPGYTMGKQSPHRGLFGRLVRGADVADGLDGGHRDVAAQVAFESNVLKPGYHLIGSRSKPGAFKLWVNWIQLAMPHHEGDEQREHRGAVQ